MFSPPDLSTDREQSAAAPARRSADVVPASITGYITIGFHFGTPPEGAITDMFGPASFDGGSNPMFTPSGGSSMQQYL